MLSRTIKIVLLTFTGLAAFVQSSAQTPTGAIKVGSPTGTTTVNIPAGYGSSPAVNYVRTWVPQQPYTAESDVIDASRTVTQVAKATAYLDGLGRLLQTVGWQSSPSQTDLVAPVTYDAFGREQYNYLPYSSTGTDGSFKTDPFTDQHSFYTGTYQSQQPALQGEQYFYNHTQF